MKLNLVGLSHKTAPVDIRERLTFPEHVQEKALQTLASNPSVYECLIVSTCNRTEIYAITSAEVEGGECITDFMCDFHNLDRAELVKSLYYKQGEDVVKHLFRVVSSLDSMVLGEAQILHQVKEAYNFAMDAGTTGRVFNELFRRSFTVGKRVRTETEIGESAVSISYAAIELAKRIFESLEQRSVLILGAGKMSELALRHLSSQGIKQAYLANRTFARAQELAERFDGVAIPFEERYDYMQKADIVVSATAASGYVLEKQALIACGAGVRRPDPLLLIDIAVPRDIEPGCGDLAQVYHYDVDALDGIVAANLEERLKSARKAETIVLEEMKNFEDWLEVMEVAPTIAAIRAKSEEIRAGELAKAKARLGDLSEKELETVERLTSAIVNKMLHEPTKVLRESSGGKRGVAAVETARLLWGLDNEESTSSEGGFRFIRSLLGRRASSASNPEPVDVES